MSFQSKNIRQSTRSNKSLSQYASLDPSHVSEDDDASEARPSDGSSDHHHLPGEHGSLNSHPQEESEDEGPVPFDSARNWPRKQKYRVLLLYSLASFLVSIAQSIVLPIIQEIGRDLNGNERSTASILTLPLIVLGLMNMIVSPYSDAYGRKSFHLGGLIIFTCASIGCGFADDIFFLLGFRLAQAFGGAAPTIVGAGAVSDMFEMNQRGQALSFFLLGPLVGPVMGPIFGGLLSSINIENYESWRVIFFVVGGTAGLLSLISFFAIKESLHPEPTSEKKRTCINPFFPLTFLKYWRVTLLLVMLTVSFAGFFVINISFPKILSNDYNLDSLTIGLCYLPFGVGLVVGAVIGGRSADRIRRRGGTAEHRLLPSLLFIPLNGAGIIAQGWVFSSEPSLAIVLLISFFLGLTFILPRPGCNTYAIEKLRALLGKDVASSANGLIFGVTLPISAIVAQLSVEGLEVLGYGVFLSIVGGALILSAIPIAIFVIRDIRRSKQQKASLLRGAQPVAYDSIN